MGGSRRKLKRNAPKVRVGRLKRKKNEKTRVPLEIAQERLSLEKRLDVRQAV